MNQSTLMKAWNVIKILQTRVSTMDKMDNGRDFALGSLDMNFCFGFWNKPHCIGGKGEES